MVRENWQLEQPDEMIFDLLTSFTGIHIQAYQFVDFELKIRFAQRDMDVFSNGMTAESSMFRLKRIRYFFLHVWN